MKLRIKINIKNPLVKPIKANQDIFLKYQKKSIFSIPIATTPAADPTIRILPPVPAEYAIKCQIGSSGDIENKEYWAAQFLIMNYALDLKFDGHHFQHQ